MPETDRQAVSTSLTAVRTATLHASSHSSDLPAYTYRLANHLLLKAGHTPSAALNAASAPSTRTSTIILPETPTPAPVAGPSSAAGPESVASGATPISMEDEGLAARVWQALSGTGTGWENHQAMVSRVQGGDVEQRVVQG